MGASDTVSSALRWGLLLLAQNPEIQERARNEIIETNGKRLPSFSDRSKLVYTDALIYEVLRFSTVQSWITRRVLSDVEILGFFIPKDTLVLPNFLAMHRDPRIWTDPGNFNPLNFYCEQTRSLHRTEFMVTFSLGTPNQNLLFIGFLDISRSEL